MSLFRFPTVAASCALLVLMICLGSPCLSQQQPPELPEAEQKQYELFRERFIKHKSWLSGASFSVMHAGTEESFKEGGGTIELLVSIDDPEEILAVVQAEGFEPFKTRVRKLLTNQEPIIRGFGAIWLFVISGTEFKKDIARLLDDKPEGPPVSELAQLVPNLDRYLAAMVLGAMEATEYAPRLLELLRSPDADDRTGAIQGLRSMHLKEHANEIAKLLSNEDDNVQAAAICTLAEFDATEFVEEIARMFTAPLSSTDVRTIAGNTLVRFNGKKWIKDIAALLDNRHRKGHAAIWLALLDAKEFTPKIARLLDDSNPIIRCDALTALGILDAQEYQTQIASHLADQEEFVQPFAAVALLLMSEQSHSNEVLEFIHAEWQTPELAGVANDPTAYFSARINVHSLLAERQKQLTSRAIENWKKIDSAKK